MGLNQWALIEWRGLRGLQWTGLLPFLFQEWGGIRPQVLVIHLGSNDLGLVKAKALIVQAREDLAFIRRRWLGVTIVWSALVPRRA